MKKILKPILLIAVCIVCTFSFVGCTITILPNFSRASGDAGTSVDAEKMTNEITREKMSAIFTIVAESRKGFFGTTTLTSQGSGVAFHQQDGCVFIITNCHVAVKREGYSSIKYTVTDYQGNSFSASLFKGAGKSSEAISPDYDLAVLYFKVSSDYSCTTLNIAASDPAVGQKIVALGAPKHQANAISFGNVVSYIKADVQAEPELSNVKFDVIWHEAFIDSGSSGGPILNGNYEIVGINYGGSEDNTMALAIPATKVREFMDEFVYE